MASPSVSTGVAQPSVLQQWRAGGGERLTYSEVAWSGASVALVLHAALHFFSVAIAELERFLFVFGPAERLALGIAEGGNPIGTWLLLLLSVGAWGALIGVVLLAWVHVATDVVRR